MPTKVVSNAYLLLEADTSVRFHFQVLPDQISEGKAVTWASQAPIGRPEPYLSYESSTSRTFSFTVKLAASLHQADNGSPADVIKNVNFLRSLAYPEVASDGLVLGPPVCLFIVGDDWIHSRVVAQSVNPTWHGPWDAHDQLGILGPMHAEVAISLIEVSLYPQSSAVVRAGLEFSMPGRRHY